MYDFKNSNAGSEAFHEAGYDAFITGLAFLRMSKAMNQDYLLNYQNNVNICFSDFNIHFGSNDIYREKVFYKIFILKNNFKKKNFLIDAILCITYK